MKILRKLRALLFKTRLEREMAEEMRAHLEAQVAANIAGGMDPAEARREAQKMFRDIEQVKERCRDERRSPWTEAWLQDSRQALRSLARSPAFVAVAVLTLALGIGVNTQMFTALRTFAIRTLPYPQSERLVVVTGQDSAAYSAGEFVAQREKNTSFDGMAATVEEGYNLSAAGQAPSVLRGRKVTAEFFLVLSAQAQLGRLFAADDDRPGNDGVAILSGRLWASRFARDPGVIGRDIELDGTTVKVVGVLSETFDDPLLWGRVDIWRPLPLRGNESLILRVVARLKAGQSIASAQAALNALEVGPTYRRNSEIPAYRVAALAYGSSLDAQGQVTWFVQGLAALVLLTACANLANLQFARTAARARENAVRTALGASWNRIVRVVLIECIVLSLCGAALGLLGARWGNAILAPQIKVAGESTAIRIDGIAVVYSSVLALGTAMLFGLLPTWLAPRIKAVESLKQGGQTATASRLQSGLRKWLIGIEVAFAVVLLATAVLFVRGLDRLVEIKSGWKPDGLLTGEIALFQPEDAATRPASRRAFYTEFESQVRALPGVDSVALGSSLPTWSLQDGFRFAVQGREAVPPADDPAFEWAAVSPSYFSTVGIRLVSGRLFSSEDGANSRKVTIINESAARTLWPGQEPIGRRLAPAVDPANREWEEVIGVVSDAEPALGETFGFHAIDQGRQLYRSLAQLSTSDIILAVRANRPVAQLAPEIQRIAANLNRGRPVQNLRFVRDEVDEMLGNLHLVRELLGAYAILGMLTAALGIYAVLSNTVVERTKEIGVRIALGARVFDVLALIAGQGLRVAAIGMLAGFAGAYGVNLILEEILPAIGRLDAMTIGFVGILFIIVALAASLVPALKAARVDPMVALRTE